MKFYVVTLNFRMYSLVFSKKTISGVEMAGFSVSEQFVRRDLFISSIEVDCMCIDLRFDGSGSGQSFIISSELLF